MKPGYSEHKEALITRLHRIEGQVRGIERMVEDDRYCIDILTQIGAVSTALESFAFDILDDHVNHCITRAIASGNEQEATEKAEELLAGPDQLVDWAGTGGCGCRRSSPSKPPC